MGLLSKIAAFAGSLLLTSSVIAQVQSQSYTWNKVAVGDGGFVPAILFHPTEKNLIYARTDMGGAYRWDETNQKWIQLLDWLTPDQWSYAGMDSFAFDPTDSGKLYILAGMYTNDWDPNPGIVLRSNDKGATWQNTTLPFKVGGNMPARGMGERLAVDPNSPNILYLGARSGNGLWKSTDSGVSFKKVTSFTADGDYVMDPSNSYSADKTGIVWVTFDARTGTKGSATKTIYVGAGTNSTSSIWRSTDAGVTWSAVAGQPGRFFPHHGILGPDGNLYVSYSDGVGPYDGTLGDVYKYNTATGVWTNISPMKSTDSGAYFGYGGLAVDAQKPGTIMVATLNSWWPDANLYRSTDGGATWTAAWEWTFYHSRSFMFKMKSANTKVDPEPQVKLGWMIEGLSIDPFNSDRMMYGTGATIWGTTDLTKWDQSGGQITLTPTVSGLEMIAALDLISPSTGANLVSAIGDLGGFVHTDLTVPQMSFVQPTLSSDRNIDFAELKPATIMRVGDSSTSGVTHAGFSTNSGSSWFQASQEPSGVSGGGYCAVAADASSFLWSPSGSNGVFYSTDYGSSWKASSGISGQAYVSSDRANGKKYYAIATSNGAFYASADGGATFKAAGANLPTTPSSNRPIKAVPGVEGDVWIATAAKGLWRSTDSGATFTQVAGVSTANSIGFGKAATGQTYPAVFITGIVNGVVGFFRSDTAGASWVRINDNAHQYGATNYAITGDPRIFGRVYVATNGFGIAYGDVAGSVSTTAPSTTKTTTTTTQSTTASVPVTTTTVKTT
ncbi:hypothetical protein HDV00_009998 [Rhizophlyctis rosea]|nr:hypothetical protein HDV00_009998 [Rhizophlyctis rosea]